MVVKAKKGKNMKKIIALSLGLACTALYAQDKPVQKTVDKPSMEKSVDKPAEKTIEKTTPVAEKAPVCECAQKPVAVKKKVVKKVVKKPVTKPTTNNISVAPNSNGVLVNSDYYHVPDPTSSKPIETWEKKISYSDVDVQINKVEQEFVISFVDKRTNKPLDSYSVKKLDTVNADVSAVSVRTDLSSSNSAKFNFSENVATFKFNPAHDRNSCEAVYFSYQLKTQEQPQVIVKFLNEDGQVSDSLGSNCHRTDPDSRETTFYTKGGHIVNIGYNQYSLTQKHKLTFDVHFTKDGREFYPPELRGYAIPRDFSTLYHLQPNADKRGAYFGVNFSKQLPQGNYYLLMGFDHDKGTDWVSNKVEVR